MAFSYDNFIKPVNPGDRVLQIYDSQDNLLYSVNPFSITNTQVYNNLVKISLRSGRVITLDFLDSTISKSSLVLLQSQVEILKSKKPFLIDKQVEKYLGDSITVEIVNTSPAATSSIVNYDFNTGSIWYHSSINTNYTANFYNLPTIDNRAITATIIISQGATGFSPNVIRIDSVTQSVKWASGTYSVSTNKVDIVGFTFLRTGASWSQVFGQISSFS